MANKFSTYTIGQRFFVQKILDLTYVNVLDSYRVRVHHPISLLEECLVLIQDWNANKIKRFETLKKAFQELVHLLESDLDNTVDYGFTTKSSFTRKLSSLIKCDDNSINLTSLYEVEYQIVYLLRTNVDYLRKLISNIENLLSFNESEIKSCIPHLDKLSLNTSFLATELIRKGYSKVKIYHLFSRTFIATNKERSFEENWSYVKNVLEENLRHIFVVVFRFDFKSNVDYLKDFDTSVDINVLASFKTSRIETFLKDSPLVGFKTFKVEALDFYQAIQKARVSLSNFLDIVHFAFDDVYLQLDQDVLVIDQNKKEKARIQKINFLIEGGYIENEERHDSLNTTIESIMENEYITNEVKSKIKSSMRYLRMGNEALELEQKYISYWIALEHIFSVNQKDTATITRMLEHLKNIQVVYYLKRNIQYLNADVIKKIPKRIVKEKFPYIEDGINYFLDENSLTLLSENISKTPLISYKVNKLKSALHSKEKTKLYIERHEDNVVSHIYRLYRIRNEIIHEAKIIPSIENITSNLKYYLTFTLNLLLDYFSNLHEGGVNDSKSSMNDFFHHHTLLYDSIKESSYDKSKLLSIPFTQSLLI